MIFAGSGDLHITNKRPENRKGNYQKHLMDKFDQILTITEDTDSKLLAVAGDIFDSPDVPYKVTREVIEIVKKHNITILVVPGQHDLRYHVSGLENTPLGILESAGAIHILSNKTPFKFQGVTFIGSGWNEEPLVDADVMVTHRMITKEGELWPGQINYASAHAILRKYPNMKCILSGDNHLPHALRIKSPISRLQINSGSMMRSTKAQLYYSPRVWLIDTDEWTTKMVKLDVLDSSQVFDFEKIAIEDTKDTDKKAASERIAQFISTLPQTDQEKPNFKNILSNLIDQVNPSAEVRNIINSTMEKVS